MSRVGKKIIEIPKDVSVTISDTKINVKGKHGSLEREVGDLVTLILEDNQLFVKRVNDAKKTRSYHGLMRALIQNMVTGVDQLFTKTLVAEGVGYKFQADKTKLVMNVGFTHPVEFAIPSDLTIKELHDFIKEWGSIGKINFNNNINFKLKFIDFYIKEEAEYFVEALDKTPFDNYIINFKLLKK